MRYFWLVAALALLASGRGRVAASIDVRSGDDLQAALDAARPGDSVRLDANTVYVGHFRLPARSGTDTTPITLETGGTPAVPECRRIGPSLASKLAKLKSPDHAPVLTTAPGARFWNVRLVEFLANADGAGDIVALGDGSAAQRSLDSVPADLTLDRVYIHGDPRLGQKRGIALNSARTTVSNSYIADIKSVDQDSQAIAGWNGPGDYTIENNYLEASGENILFGGADPAIPYLVPTNIVIRGNTISKPLAWHDPAAPWVVKNLVELKNAAEVTVDQNIIEHSWPQAQSGFAIVLTTRNQDGGCPWCQVQQVHFTGNLVRDVAAGINVLGYDDTHVSRQTNGITFRNNVFDGIDRKTWGGSGYFLQMTNNPQDIVIDHNTVVSGDSGGIALIENSVAGFAFTNNIATVGEYGIAASGRGLGNDAIRASLPGANITGNILVGAIAGSYPAGNIFPTAEQFYAQLMNFAAHDLRLKPSSPWTNAATDRTTPGANGPNGAPLPVYDPALTPCLSRDRSGPVKRTLGLEDQE
jgi:hypothetical protein